MADPERSVGVVGGGLLGMVLSLRLAQAGLRVTLIEGAAETGGAAGSCALGDHVWDRFYHVILLSDSHLRALLRELGLEDRLAWGVTRTGYYTAGKLHSVSNVVEYLTFPALSPVDKLRLGWTVFYGSRIGSWRRLEKLTSVAWLKRHSGRSAFEKFWRPLLESKLGSDHVKASAAFIWATIARLYAARKTGLKKEMFGYVEGGYRTVLQALDRALRDSGAEVLTGTPARKITSSGAGVDVELAPGVARRFDRVVLTVPSTRILEICPQLSEEERTRLGSIVHQDLLCAAFLLRKPLAGFYVTNLAARELPFTGIIEMTALVDRANFGGLALVYLPRYLAKGDPFFLKSDGEIAGLFMAALRTVHPGLRDDDLAASCVSRLVDFPVVPTLDYSERSLPPTATSLGNVFVVNSAQIPGGTNNVNEIVGLADRKAREISEARG